MFRSRPSPTCVSECVKMKFHVQREKPDKTNPTIRGIQECSKQSFHPHHPGDVRPPPPFYFLPDKTNLLGPMPSRRRSPTPRVRKPPRVSVSSTGGSTSLSLKPEACNSLELIIIATGDRDVSTSGVHSWNVSPDVSSSTLSQ